jgi:hypothetical protein
MARSKNRQSAVSVTEEEAGKIARGTQQPGQTKEQTRLITQGIRKGIEQYKKQQSAKARELDRNLKKVKRQLSSADSGDVIAVADDQEKSTRPTMSLLPWFLLLLTWIGIGAYLLLTSQTG